MTHLQLSNRAGDRISFGGEISDMFPLGSAAMTWDKHHTLISLANSRSASRISSSEIDALIS